jgi:hypothetical protein
MNELHGVGIHDNNNIDITKIIIIITNKAENLVDQILILTRWGRRPHLLLINMVTHKNNININNCCNIK